MGQRSGCVVGGVSEKCSSCARRARPPPAVARCHLRSPISTDSHCSRETVLRRQSDKPRSAGSSTCERATRDGREHRERTSPPAPQTALLPAAGDRALNATPTTRTRTQLLLLPYESCAAPPQASKGNAPLSPPLPSPSTRAASLTSVMNSPTVCQSNPRHPNPSKRRWKQPNP